MHSKSVKGVLRANKRTQREQTSWINLNPNPNYSSSTDQVNGALRDHAVQCQDTPVLLQLVAPKEELLPL